MPTIWTTYDPLGQSVTLTDAAWDHISSEHLELARSELAVRRTIEDPDVCTRELDDSLNYYRRDVLPAGLGRYLHVVVRAGTSSDLDVRTAWPADFVDAYEERLC